MGTKAETEELAIDVRGLRKAYGGMRAAWDLDFALPPGRILGLVGPNGAGKTTAMRCMAGIIPATAGSIKIFGQDLRKDPVAAKRLLTFVPDTPHLFDYLSVEEHLQFLGRVHQLGDIDERADRLLEAFDLSDKRRHLPEALSRGMKQKVVICIGFLHDPRAIFLDEPLTGLDPRGIRSMKDAIVARAREQNAAVIISSHQLELIEEICDEIFVIAEGRHVASGSLGDIRASLEGVEEGSSLEEIFFRVTEKSAKVDPS
ncbi:MAG: ABC transporter ATP-binding protein [Planctomycetota bacterium]